MSLFDSYGNIGQEPYQTPDRFDINDYISDISTSHSMILQVTGTYTHDYILNAKTDGLFYNKFHRKGATIILPKHIVESLAIPLIGYKEAFNYNKFWDDLNEEK